MLEGRSILRQWSHRHSVQRPDEWGEARWSREILPPKICFANCRSTETILCSSNTS